MRICSPQLGLAPNSILGGEVFDREILLGLAKKGIKIEIILPKNKPYDQNIKNWNISYLPFSHFPAIFGSFLIVPYLFNIHRKRKFNIIRIHQPQFLGLGALLFKIFHPEVKLLATYHQFRESNFWIFSDLINKFWDHIICDSENVKNQINRIYKVPESKITVVHNGVPNYLKPTKKDRKLVKKFKLRGKFVLLFMGLFTKRKNPLFLLDVLKKLAQKRSDIVLIFWGDGSLKRDIIKRSKELKVYSMVRIINPVYGPKKNNIHNLADIFVHPAKDEGFALAPLEAMACAKPIVITDGYSAAEAVTDSINGFLCHSNDPNHWSEKLSQLINDHELRKRMGRASLKKVKKEFQWSTAVEKHVEVFRKVNSNKSV